MVDSVRNRRFVREVASYFRTKRPQKILDTLLSRPVKKKRKKKGLSYLRTLAPSWTEAEQARAARKEAKVTRHRRYLSGARMFG